MSTERTPRQLNRKSRRATERRHHHSKNPAEIIKNLYQAKNEVEAKSHEVAEANGRNMVSIVYRGEPYIQTYLRTYRSIHHSAGSLRASSAFKDSLDQESHERNIQKIDLFSQGAKGVSLADIEGMHVDEKSKLSIEDIDRIDKIFFSKKIVDLRGKIDSTNKDRASLQTAITVFIGQAWARPEVPTAPDFERLRRNLTAYLDYYADLHINPTLSLDAELDLARMIVFGGTYFRTLFGIYLPARYGITSSSAVKTYEQHMAHSNLIIRRMWAKFFRKLYIPLTQNAFREGAFPEDLEHYQFYNEENDSKAAKLLRKHYKPRLSDDEEQFKAHSKAEKLLQSLVAHRKHLFKEIIHSPDRRIEFDTPDNIVERVTITAQNKQTLVFILHLPSDLHLTLEIDRQGRVFGIPVSLLRRAPHIENFLVTDVLNPLIEKIDPQLPTQKKHVYRPPIRLVKSGEVTEDVPEPKPKRKRKIKITKERDLTSVTVAETPPYHPKFVSYSEQRVRELLPGKKPREKDVEHLMEVIRLFEQGWRQAVRITKDKTIFRLRVGDYRVRLKMIGQGRFVIMDIGDRETFDTVKGYRKGFA